MDVEVKAPSDDEDECVVRSSAGFEMSTTKNILIEVHIIKKLKAKVGGIMDVEVKAPSEEEDESVAADEESVLEDSSAGGGDKSESEARRGSTGFVTPRSTSPILPNSALWNVSHYKRRVIPE